MKKRLLQRLAVFFAVLAISATISCTHDDDAGPQVKYVLAMQNSSVIVTGISYRNGANQVLEGFGTNETTNNWSKTVDIQPPFSATFSVTANNTTEAEIPYTMTIFYKGQSVATKQGSVPPNSGIFTDNLSYDVAN